MIEYSETEIDKKARREADLKCRDYLEKKANHGRREFFDIEILPAAPYLDLNVKNPHKGVNVLIKKSKTVITLRKKSRLTKRRLFLQHCITSIL